MSDNPIQGVPVVFPLGTTVATRGAMEKMTYEEMLALLKRHAGNDWGDISVADVIMNEDALKCGERIMSVYHVRGDKFYVITERDRSRTTLMLSDEY